MVSYEVIRTAPASAGDQGVVIYCKLFSDMVTGHLCALRRKELDERAGFSCDGCVMKKNIMIGTPAHLGGKLSGMENKCDSLG